MTYETILYREEGPVGWVTLNRPDDGNMFTPQMCHDIRDCINDVRRETRTRVLVITGPNTGWWGTFAWVGQTGVSLTAGQHVLRVHAEEEYFNLDAVRITQ